jgi:hypothetical protein
MLVYLEQGGRTWTFEKTGVGGGDFQRGPRPKGESKGGTDRAKNFLVTRWRGISIWAWHLGNNGAAFVRHCCKHIAKVILGDLNDVHPRPSEIILNDLDTNI